MRPTLEFFKPDITASGSNISYVPEGKSLIDLPFEGEISFNLQADGGFWEMSTGMGGRKGDVEDWLEGGLGRHVVVWNSAGGKVWEGFVNQVTGSLGSGSIQRGPLLNICNRCGLRYALELTVENDQAPTQDEVLAILDDETSKLTYGVFEKQVSAGRTTDQTEAEYLQQVYLYENRWPATTKTIGIGNAGQTAIQLQCVGYIHFLKNYIYTANTPGTDNTSVPIYDPPNSKLTDVLEADPNDLFTDSDKWDFDTVSTDVTAWEEGDSDAWSIIKDMLDRGDGSGNRLLFGCYADRKLKLEVMPTTISYEHNVTDPAQRVLGWGDVAEIMPWNVEAGKWLFMSDFMSGRRTPLPDDVFRQDPRNMFLERVAYSSPDGLQLDGEKLFKFKQLMADFGLG